MAAAVGRPAVGRRGTEDAEARAGAARRHADDSSRKTDAAVVETTDRAMREG